MDYSLELEAKRIPDPVTREHFREVLECYWRGNQRAAMVTLWVVVVFDLLRKLEAARVSYGDEKAGGVLDKIKQLQKDHPRSSEWEWTLVELIEERTSYLSGVDVEKLEGIRRHRHLAAHPTLEDDISLYSPSPEKVRAKLRDAMEVVLQKREFMTKEVFASFVEELERLREGFASRERLRAHLETKYLDRIPEHVEASIFRSLWKFVFSSTGAREAANRAINFRALRILWDRNPAARRAQVEDEKGFYEQVEATAPQVAYLTHFLQEHPELFNVIDGVRAAVRECIDSTPTIQAANWFEQSSFQDYMNEVAQRVESTDYYYFSDEVSDYWEEKGRQLLHPTALRLIVKKAIDVDLVNAAIHTAIHAYGRASSYDAANGYFSGGVARVLDRMDGEQLQTLLEKIEDNRQTYDRDAATDEHKLVKRRVDDELGPDFDYSSYPKFCRSIGFNPEE